MCSILSSSHCLYSIHIHEPYYCSHTLPSPRNANPSIHLQYFFYTYRYIVRFLEISNPVPAMVVNFSKPKLRQLLVPLFFTSIFTGGMLSVFYIYFDYKYVNMYGLCLEILLSLCSIVFIFPIDCCITKPRSSWITLYNNASIAYKHHTNNNPSIKFQPLNQPLNQLIQVSHIQFGSRSISVSIFICYSHLQRGFT